MCFSIWVKSGYVVKLRPKRQVGLGSYFDKSMRSVFDCLMEIQLLSITSGAERVKETSVRMFKLQVMDYFIMAFDMSVSFWK